MNASDKENNTYSTYSTYSSNNANSTDKTDNINNTESTDNANSEKAPTPEGLFRVDVLRDGGIAIDFYDSELCPQDVIIPETWYGTPVTEIAPCAFSGCSSLRSVTIPDCIRTIGRYAFGSCLDLECVNITQGVKRIEHEAFFCCLSLRSISLPEGLLFIGDGAFAHTDKIERIIIPASVESIEGNPFEGIPLSAVDVADGNKSYAKINNCIVELKSGRLVAGD